MVRLPVRLDLLAQSPQGGGMTTEKKVVRRNGKFRLYDRVGREAE